MRLTTRSSWCLLLVLVLLGSVTGAMAQPTTITNVVPVPGGGRLVGAQVAAVANGTTTVATFTSGGAFNSMTVLINVTAGGTDSGTVQWFIEDSMDNGTTWSDLIASALFTFGSPVTTQRFFVQGNLPTVNPQFVRFQGAPQVTETLLPGSVRHGPWGNRFRVREVVSNIAGTPTGATYNVDVLFK